MKSAALRGRRGLVYPSSLASVSRRPFFFIGRWISLDLSKSPPRHLGCALLERARQSLQKSLNKTFKPPPSHHPSTSGNSRNEQHLHIIKAPTKSPVVSSYARPRVWDNDKYIYSIYIYTTTTGTDTHFVRYVTLRIIPSKINKQIKPCKQSPPPKSKIPRFRIRFDSLLGFFAGFPRVGSGSGDGGNVRAWMSKTQDAWLRTRVDGGSGRGKTRKKEERKKSKEGSDP